MSKKVLITGGSGLLGSRITEQLLREGFTVNHLSRNPGKQGKVESFYWDPEKGEMNEKALIGVDYIINLAGAGIADKRWTKERKKVIKESRTKSTALLRDYIEKGNYKVKALISASGMGYYGQDNGDRWQTEKSRFGDDFVATVTKDWEAEAQAYGKLGIRVVIFRFGIVLSNKGGALPKLSLPVKLGLGAPLGPGDQWMSWVHIEYVADAVSFALSHENVQGVYNIGSPEPVTNREFNKKAAGVLNRPTFLPNVPAFSLRLVLGEMASTVLGSCRMSPEKFMKEGFTFKFENLEDALKDLYK